MSFQRTVELSFQENSSVFRANICFGYKISPEGYEQPTEEYLLIQGITWDEIILLRKTAGTAPTTPGEPIELIENFQKSYINLVFYGHRNR